MNKMLLLLIALSWLSFATAQDSSPYRGYRGYVDVALGDAYNFNTAQTISINNMQWYSEITTTHGYEVNNWFVGSGIGYYHSFRDKENMYPIYVAGLYTFEKVKFKPYIEARAGIVYDPLWIETIQEYGAISIGLKAYKGLQVGLRGNIFSRPSRFFTANAAVVLSYAISE